jgi:hypothetical protein
MGLLSKRGAWTQRAYARDAGDNVVYAGSKSACSWCLSGAIIEASYSLDISPSLIGQVENYASGAVYQTISHMGFLSEYPSVEAFNDRQCSKAPVLDMLRRTIERLS